MSAVSKGPVIVRPTFCVQCGQQDRFSLIPVNAENAKGSRYSLNHVNYVRCSWCMQLLPNSGRQCHVWNQITMHKFKCPCKPRPPLKECICLSMPSYNLSLDWRKSRSGDKFSDEHNKGGHSCRHCKP